MSLSPPSVERESKGKKQSQKLAHKPNIARMSEVSFRERGGEAREKRGFDLISSILVTFFGEFLL